MNIITYNLQEFCNRSNIKFDTIANVHHTFGFHTLCMAGGAVRRTLIAQKLDSDFDFFFKNEERFNGWLENAKFHGFQVVSENEHQVTLDGTMRINGKDTLIKLQGIRISWYQTVEELFDSFDYTITQFAIQTPHWSSDIDGLPDFSTYELHASALGLWDLARRKLAVHKITYPVASMRRMIKYADQGFTACGGAMTELLEQTISNPDSVDLKVKYLD